MDSSKQKEIEKTIANPITKSMKPGQKALSSTIAKSGPTKLAPNQISTQLDKWENKIANKRKPTN